jgi:hypothetical protein
MSTLIVALSLLTIATAMALIVALVSVGGVLRCPLLGYVVGAVGQPMRSADKRGHRNTSTSPLIPHIHAPHTPLYRGQWRGKKIVDD